MRTRTSIYDRLDDKFIVDEVTGCWVWVGAVASSGYGKIGAGGKWGKTISAHRVAWEKVHGEVPGKLQVLHRCDNKLCVNPQHLWVGTQVDNIQDCISKGRIKTTKLTKDQVVMIRSNYQKGVGTTEISRALNVHQTTIQRVVSRKTWGHI